MKNAINAKKRNGAVRRGRQESAILWRPRRAGTVRCARVSVLNTPRFRPTRVMWDVFVVRQLKSVTGEMNSGMTWNWGAV